MRKVARTGIALSLVIGFSLSAGGAAQAERERDRRAQGGTKEDGITAGVSRVRITGGSSKGGGNTVQLTPANPGWKAPACWYEPKTSPKELKEKIESAKPKKRKPAKKTGTIFDDLNETHNNLADGLSKQVVRLYEDYYQTDKYKNYNMAKQGKGMFWEGVKNPRRKDDPEADKCSRHAYWVDEGDPAPKNVPLAVSPKVLAEYAYEELPIPRTEISLNPEGKQTVNLDTWVWADKEKFKPVSVTASLDNPAMSATTTAKPVSLTLEPGTDEARTFPASGKCKLGEPYSAGRKDETPPCGVRYLRATSGNGAYPLKATLTWEISWTSTDGPGGDLPAGSFSTTHDVTVREIQSVVRD
ncbi:hypothetical protein [Streptomyces albus]|uniref:hypothetical protein n=1 Tax=Streptomyces albus TaxID=1888 RepID=UPI0033C8BDA3